MELDCLAYLNFPSHCLSTVAVIAHAFHKASVNFSDNFSEIPFLLVYLMKAKLLSLSKKEYV